MSIKNLNPEWQSSQGTRRNFRTILQYLSGDILMPQYVLLAGTSGGQTILQGLTLEGGVVVNDLGADVDFRVEGDTEPNLLFVDGSTDRVGIGTSSPSQRVHVFKDADEQIFLLVQNPNTGTTALGGLRAQSDGATVNFQAHGSGRTATRFGKTLGGWSEFLQVTGNGLLLGTISGPMVLGTNSSMAMEITTAQNIGMFAEGSYGGGSKVLFIANRTTAPASNPTNGVILYSEDVSASARLKMRDEAGLVPTIGGVIFTQTADKTVTNTTTETSVFGTGLGSLTLPANSLTVGRTLRVKIAGIYSTPNIGTPSATVRVKIGSTTIASGTTSNFGTGATDLRFVGDLLITCRSIGATGSVVLDGGINYNAPGSNEPVSDPLNNVGATTSVDTTVSNALDVTLQWDSASTSREVVSTVATVEALN